MCGFDDIKLMILTQSPVVWFKGNHFWATKFGKLAKIYKRLWKNTQVCHKQSELNDLIL